MIDNQLPHWIENLLPYWPVYAIIIIVLGLNYLDMRMRRKMSPAERMAEKQEIERDAHLHW